MGSPLQDVVNNSGSELASDQYESLLLDSAFLDALRGAGVDNWDGYDQAQDMLKEWNK